MAIRELALRNPRGRDAASLFSMYLEPNETLLTLDVDFERDSTADEIVAAIEHDIRAQHPKISRICIEARSIVGATRITSPHQSSG